jgi:hypothetical protein
MRRPRLAIAIGMAIGLLGAAPSAMMTISASTGILAAGRAGGPFAPASFTYHLDATQSWVNYFVSGVPYWMDASSTFGRTPADVTFSINAQANSLNAGSYSATITVSNVSTALGTATIPVSLAVTAVGITPPPTCAMAASPTTIIQGQSATLSWNSTNATSATIAPGIGTVDPNGSAIVTSAAPTTYVGTFTGYGGTASCIAMLQVISTTTSYLLCGNDVCTTDTGDHLLAQ